MAPEQQQQQQNIDFILAPPPQVSGRLLPFDVVLVVWMKKNVRLLHRQAGGPVGERTAVFANRGFLAVKFGERLPEWPPSDVSASCIQKREPLKHFAKTDPWYVFCSSSISTALLQCGFSIIIIHHDPVVKQPQHVRDSQAIPPLKSEARRRKISSKIGWVGAVYLIFYNII